MTTTIASLTPWSGGKNCVPERGATSTPLRRRVLNWSGTTNGRSKPMPSWTGCGGDKSAAPPTVYRALISLLEHGLVHKIESLNDSSSGATTRRDRHVSQFLICTNQQRG